MLCPSFVAAFAAFARSTPRRALSLLLLAIALTSIAGVAAESVVFGPETFRRDTGPPVTATRTFTVTRPERPYVLRVRSDGVASGVIAVNGQPLLGPNDFPATPDRPGRAGAVDNADAVAPLEHPVTLIKGANTIAVELRGAPGTSLTIEIVTTAPDTTPPTIDTVTRRSERHRRAGVLGLEAA
jgi:hypothetical protein